jgi:hypothetical protein
LLFEIRLRFSVAFCFVKIDKTATLVTGKNFKALILNGFRHKDWKKVLTFIFAATSVQLNVVVEWLTTLPLLRIREVLDSNLGSETGCPDCGVSWFLSVLPGRCWDSTLKLGDDRFLTHHFQFVIHLSLFNSTLYRPSHWKSVLKDKNSNVWMPLRFPRLFYGSNRAETSVRWPEDSNSSNVAHSCRKRRLKWVPSAWGYSRVTLSPGVPYTEAWSFRMGVGHGFDSPAP